MKKLSVLIVAALLSAVALVTGTAGAAAGKTECSGPPVTPGVLGPPTLPPGTYESIVVPPGATCVLRDSVILRNVTVLEGGALFLFDSSIGGNVKGQAAGTVRVVRSAIGGNILVNEGGPAPFGPVVFICGSTVEHNVVINGITGGLVIRLIPPSPPGAAPGECGPTLVGGNLLVHNNTLTQQTLIEGVSVGRNLMVVNNAGDAPKVVRENTVEGNLLCRGNAVPFSATANVAERASGQCAGGTSQ